jgi:hypothetical protein
MTRTNARNVGVRITCFAIIAVHELKTPSVTANWQPRAHPCDALNETIAVEDLGGVTVAISQGAVQSASCATENEN